MPRRTRPVRPAPPEPEEDDEGFRIIYGHATFPADAAPPATWEGLAVPALAVAPESDMGAGYSWLVSEGDLEHQRLLIQMGVTEQHWIDAGHAKRTALLSAARLVSYIRKAVLVLAPMARERKAATLLEPAAVEALGELSRTLDRSIDSREGSVRVLNRDEVRRRLSVERPLLIREFQRMKLRLREFNGKARAVAEAGALAEETNRRIISQLHHDKLRVRPEHIVRLWSETPTVVAQAVLARERFGPEHHVSVDDVVRSAIRVRRSRRQR